MHFHKKNTKLSSDVKFIIFSLFELAGNRYPMALKHLDNFIGNLYQVYRVVLIKSHILTKSNQ